MTDIYLFHAWHNKGLCVLTPEEFIARLKEVRREKPADELDLRLHYLMVHMPPERKAKAEWGKAKAEWEKAWAEWAKAQAKRDKAWAEWEKAWAEWDKAKAEREKARAELDKAWAERDKALAKWGEALTKFGKAQAEWDRKWHPILCHPKCAWTPENRDIFAKGKSLERLLR